MKRILLIAIFLFAPMVAYSQCTASPGFVCVSQDTMDRTAKALDEIPKLRDLVAKQATSLNLSDAERVAAQALVKALNDALDIRGRLIVDYEKMMTVYERVIAMQTQLIEKLTAQINKPRSAWQKFLTTLKEIAILAAGITLGRGL
jgi:flagellar biosynthesis chaperone FliJ